MQSFCGLIIVTKQSVSIVWQFWLNSYS